MRLSHDGPSLCIYLIRPSKSLNIIRIILFSRKMQYSFSLPLYSRTPHRPLSSVFSLFLEQLKRSFHVRELQPGCAMLYYMLKYLFNFISYPTENTVEFQCFILPHFVTHKEHGNNDGHGNRGVTLVTHCFMR
jgi:hypothetical protein